MKELKSYNDVVKFCKAMSSPLRASIVEQLTIKKHMNLQELAQSLGVTNGALTSHIKMLSEAGIIHIENTNGAKGVQKICSLQNSTYLLHLASDKKISECHEIEIPVGSYSDYSIRATCGLATPEHIIGYFDNPVFFDDPERIYASILWFYNGYVEYNIPNYLEKNQRLTEIRISQEISSEAPGIREDWPSDIHFSINKKPLGIWTSPSDFGTHRGVYSPDWWLDGYNQYGLLKTLSINDEGCFMDNKKISDYRLSDLGIQNGKSFKYRIGVPEDSLNVGGMTLFGRHFGNYNQNIKVSLIYELTSKKDS